MDEVPVTKARVELSELVNRVVYGGERVVLTRHGRAVAALVSAGDLARLEGATGAAAPVGDGGAHLSVAGVSRGVMPPLPPTLAPAAEQEPLPGSAPDGGDLPGRESRSGY